jgi:hypothetical protein
MPSANSLSGLMKWLGREPWRKAFEEVFERHLRRACDHADIEIEDLADLIGTDMVATLWGCAFEDFLTQEVDDFGNIVDDYLKRRGWNEKALDRAYMEGLRSSVMSIYEVSDIQPGKSLLAHDLFRGGDPVLVSEGTATRSLKQWDRIAARLVKQRGKVVLGGGLLSLDRDLAEKLLAALRHTADRAADETAELFTALDVSIDDLELGEAASHTELLRRAAPLISTVWLSDSLQKVLDPQLPELFNADGEEIVFTSLHYRLHPDVSETEVREVLDRMPELRANGPDIWSWWAPADATKGHLHAEAPSGLAFVSSHDDGTPILGTLELTSERLQVSVNSEDRAARARALIESALEGSVQEPLVERQDLDQLLSKTTDGPPSPPDSPEITAEEARQIVHQSLDRYYREQLDTPIPALENVSPRQAIKTAQGCENVVEWLKRLENLIARQDSSDPMANYETTWLWDELGLRDRRF